MASLRIVFVGMMVCAVVMLSCADEAPTTAAPALNTEKLAERFSELFHSFNHTANELFASVSEKAKVQFADAAKKLQEGYNELKTKIEESKTKTETPAPAK